MVSILRKYEKSLMLVITVVVIVGMVWLFNGTRTLDRVAGTHYVGSIYGRQVSEIEAQREARKFRIASLLQLTNLQNALVGQAYTQDEAFSNFIWNGFILRHESANLGINPTEDEVRTAIMALPAFQTNGAFDSGKHALFVENFLNPQGFTHKQLEDLMRDNICLEKIEALLESGFEISPQSFRTAYTQNFQKLDVSVINFNLGDFQKDIQVSDDDVKKVYDLHPENYKSEEKICIKYVKLGLPESDKALAAKDRTDALQKLSDRANELTQKMIEKGAKFDEVAAKFELPVTTTDLFTQSKPDTKIAEQPGVVAAAEQLTTAQPDSDPVQVEDGYYILHLEESVPSKPLTLDEARPQITETLKQSRAREAMNLKATDVRNKIAADLKAGKSFADAAQAQGMKVDNIPPSSIAEPSPETPNARQILARASQLPENGLSDFIPDTDSGLLIHLDKREPIDEQKFEKDKPLLAPRLVQLRLNLVFADWIRKQRQQAKIEVPHQSAPAPQQPQPGAGS